MSRPLNSIFPLSKCVSTLKRGDVHTGRSTTRLKAGGEGPSFYGDPPDRQQLLLRFRVHVATQLPMGRSPGRGTLPSDNITTKKDPIRPSMPGGKTPYTDVANQELYVALTVLSGAYLFVKGCMIPTTGLRLAAGRSVKPPLGGKFAHKSII